MSRIVPSLPLGMRSLAVEGGCLLALAAVALVWWGVVKGGGSPLDPVSADGLAQADEPPAPGGGDRPDRDRSKQIEIGMSAPFTGPSRGLGVELYRGSMAYFEHLNRQGGIHGRTVTIRAYDDGYNPGPAVENSVRLIERDDVLLLFDYVGTPTTTRCLPLLKKYGDRSAFLFFPFTGAQPQRQSPYGDFAFNLRASYYQETAGLVDHLVAVGRRRVAVFYQVDAYGRTGWEGVRAALERHQLAMAGEATYRRGTDFQESVGRQVELLRAADADAVICIGSYGACAAFVRDARDAGWQVPIANISFAASENLLDLLLAAGRAKGVDYTPDLIQSEVMPSYNDQTLPAVREYREFMDRYQPLPPGRLLSEGYQPKRYSSVSLEGFLNARVLSAILKQMGPPFERRRLKRAAESVRDLDVGIGVPVSFAPDRHQGVDRVYYTTVRGGQFEPLDDWRRWEK